MDLVNFVMTLLSWLTILVGSLIVTLKILFCWIYFYRLMQVFVLQKLVLHWEILVMLLSQFTLTFNQTQKGMPCLIV